MWPLLFEQTAMCCIGEYQCFSTGQRNDINKKNVNVYLMQDLF